jgi:phosphopantothenoylcysteine decarboxylase / phosphopantothenate---cysteine ligase
MALIALGVTGGIGAYKAVEIARGLQQHGHEVSVVMTRGATRFVRPLTFEAITRRAVITDQFARGLNADVEHIALASKIDLLLVAPATANIIGKFANGIADDFLSSLYLATRAEVVMAPAMNTNMLEHEAVRRNLEMLGRRGVLMVDPGSGYLACGWIGRGRLAEPEEVVAAVETLLAGRGSLAGRRVVVTAGPTYEDIDPVRYLGNRSSGRMGFALAAEAMRRGAEVVLVAGPSPLEPPASTHLTRVRSAEEMHAAVMEHAPLADAVVMAAAVADFRPALGRQGQKVAKEQEMLSIALQRTPDILADLGRSRAEGGLPLLIGFAAETHDVVARARRKLREKRVDLIVANDVSRHDAGFEVDTNQATFVTADGEVPFPLESKDALAGRIADWLAARLQRAAEARPAHV